MKTNQMMTVAIGSNQTVKIGHLTKMGSLNDVLEIGNSYRINEGLQPITLNSWLWKRQTWEFINEVDHQLQLIDSPNETPKRHFDVLESNDDGRVDYSDLIKNSPIIKSQRGGKVENRGVWANLYIMIKLAAYMSPKLEFEIIDCFIHNKILMWRDISGDEFKALNKAIDSHLPWRKSKTSNRGIFIQTAKLLNEKILGGSGNWNDASSDQLNLRADLEGKLISYLEMGFIRDWEHLKEVIGKL